MDRSNYWTDFRRFMGGFLAGVVSIILFSLYGGVL